MSTPANTLLLRQSNERKAKVEELFQKFSKGLRAKITAIPSDPNDDKTATINLLKVTATQLHNQLLEARRRDHISVRSLTHLQDTHLKLQEDFIRLMAQTGIERTPMSFMKL
jgi:hypothetical protein